ncbi:hypothetical protein Cpir12675_005469 [Ceratocystis pirilliformis]|uniref:Translation initiation factor IF-3 n=1 Tax=Ceratocystis pirilliformis TaxID=259994 RepID=A0ABR3YQV9_9PEZI
MAMMVSKIQSAPTAIPIQHSFSTMPLRLNKYRKQLDPSAMPRDWDITAPEVMVADNRGIRGPTRTSTILEKLDLGTYSLRMVVNPGGQLPICRVVHIATEAELERKRQMVEGQKLKKKSAKAIEINWNTTKHDLSYRMKQLGEFLNKGFVVTITMTRKRRKEQSTKEHIAEVTEWVRDAVNAANGSISKEDFDSGTMTHRFNVERKSMVVHWNIRKDDPIYSMRQLTTLLEKGFLVNVVFSSSLEAQQSEEEFKRETTEWGMKPIADAGGRILKDETESKSGRVSRRITVDHVGTLASRKE